MIIPASAHVAWRKGAEYFGLKLKMLPLGGGAARRRLAARGADHPNTAVIVGSAPDYPHGTIDPIAEMAEIAARRGAPMHVDACVGGFICRSWR